jgi:iron complex transport system ATP-binding protein
MTALRLLAKDVHVRLGGRNALAGISVAIEPGQFTIVVGPNGAGKTTLLRVLAGLIATQRGTVMVDARPLHTLAASQRAKAIAYLPQGGGIAWPIPVASVVALGRMPHGERGDALPEAGRRAVATAIEAVGLKGFEERPATELSGGERARVLLARALATEAPILLADEPVAALDPRHQLLVLGVLRARAGEVAAVVAVMHDLALAARFADRVLLIRDGRLAADGAPREVLTAAELAASFGIEAEIVERDGMVLLTPWRALT